MSLTRLKLLVVPAVLALGAGCFDFDKAFEDCKTSGFCTGDGGVGGPVSITTTLLQDAYVGRPYTQTLTATGGTGTFAWSVTAGALPAGLSLSADGVLSGTATDPGDASFTVTASSAGHAADQPLTLAVLAPLQLAIAALPDAYTGQPYSRSIGATGGKPPYNFAVQGGVPPDGLTLTSAGVLTGTPSFAFSGNVTIRVSDANNQVTATPLPFTIFAPPAITTSQLPDGYTNEAFSATLAVVDGKAPYAFSISMGTLPPGLSLDTATGQLSGTPTVPQGTVTVWFTASDANGKAVTRPLSVGIYAPVSITSATTLPDAYTSTGYDFTLARSGGKGTLFFSVTTGSLPAGLSLSFDGRLTGSPLSSSVTPSSFSITATDGNGRADTKPFTLQPYDPPRIPANALADATLNVAYSDQLVATGGKAPLTWALSNGSLPNGLSLSTATGVVGGLPINTGTTPFGITVTDANGITFTKAMTCTVYGAITIGTGALAAAYAGGVPYTFNLAAAGGKAPYTWTLLSGPLPAPLTLSASGTISGTPAAAGTFPLTFQVTDANSNTTSKALPLGIVPAPSITTASLDDGYIGLAYAASVQAQDGLPPYQYSLTGTLPNGLSLNAATGQISGTPSSAASANVTVHLLDGNNLTTSQTYAFGTYASPQVTTSSLPDGYVGDAFSQALGSAGGKPPYTWSVAGGAFPAGLTLNGNGTVTGTPAAPQTTSATVRLSDANAHATTSNVTQQIYAPPSIVTSLSDGYAGVAYPSTTLMVNGGKSPFTFSLSAGSLPAGMTFTAATGTLSGTPSAAGSSSFTVTVTDANARGASVPMSLPVYTLPSVTTAALADAYAGASYSASLAGAGGKPPIAWNVSSGTLPSGLSLSGGGVFSGSSGSAGSSTFTVQMTDANGQQATRSLTLAVLQALSVTTTSVADGYVGSAYSTAALGATGGRPPYTFSAVGALPSGVSLGSGGAFSGTPTASGTSTFDARVTDANNASSQRTLALSVYNPPSVAGSLGDAYQGTSYSGALTGSNGKAPYSFAVTSGALPAGLSLSSGGTVTGTPATTGSATFTVTLTDANSVTATRTLTVDTLSPLAVTTASLPDGYPGRSYSATLAATGGRTPYTFSITSGALPGGLSLGSGVISGTPAATGSSSVTVTATDANGVPASQAFTLPVLAPPSITTTALPDGYAGTAYAAASLAGTGGRAPYTFSAAGGLPPGVSVSGAGAFSGTPTGSAASYPFSATITDANGVTGNANLTIAVWAALVVGGGGLPDGYLATAYSAGLSATGGKTPYTWSVGGALPAGVTLNASSGGLSGTPTAVGTASFAAQVSDANGVTAGGAKVIQTFALPSIGTTTLANCSQGVPYSASLAVSGGKPPFTWSGGAGLPTGLSLASDGTLAGTTSVAPGAFPFSATVTDANGKTDNKSLSLQVVIGLNITTSAINDGYATLAFTPQALGLTGAGGTVTWSVISGALPPGLALGPGNGTISGTPTTAGTYNFTVQASDTVNGTTSKAFTQVIYALPSVATTSLPDAYTDQAYSQALAVSGGKAPYAWTLTVGMPPSGITFNGGSSGTLSGQAAAAGGSGFTVQVTDAHGQTATRSLSITVYSPPVQTSPVALPDGYIGRPYTGSITVTGGKPGFQYTVTSGALPGGLSLNLNSGVLTGSPSGATGLYNFTVTVADANGRTAVMAHTITVYDPPTVTTSSLPQGYYQVSYGSVALAASGGVTPYNWSLTGTLPSGLSMSTAGVITGTPTNAAGGTSNFSVTVTDANGITANRALSITTAAQLTITTLSLPDAYIGTGYNVSVTVAGGRSPYGFVVASGAPPAGLTMSSTGTFSGTPSGPPGGSPFVVRVTDANGTQATQSLTINVLPPCAITTTSLPDGYTTLAYGSVLAGSGGKPPYTWSVTAGILPGGILLNGTNGQLSGTPSAPATATPTFTLTDANMVSVSAPLPLNVYNLPSISTSTVPDAYANQPYGTTLLATGGKPPLSWTLSSGTLPPGLTVGGSGTIGSNVGSVSNGQSFSFTVALQDANGKTASRALAMTGYQLPSITTGGLIDATEGITYMKAPGVFMTITAVNGKAPWSFSATGLPGGLVVDGPTGQVRGIPSQGASLTSPYSPQLQVTDANFKQGTSSSTLRVLAAQPIRTGGANATAPGGSPITDALTVFVIDSSGNPVPNAGVRVRKNGMEYMPFKDQLTDAAGKAFFSGMNLSNGSDKVDVTASGPNITTTTMAGINAALMTLSVNRLDVPPLRAGAAASYDPNLRKLVVTGGTGSYRNPSAFTRNACLTDAQRLESFSPSASWTRTVPPGMNASPPGRTDAAFAYSSAGTQASYLFGGASCSGVPLNDLWRYLSSNNTWSQLSVPNGPSPRQMAAMATDGTGKLALFGGLLSGDVASNELWRFDPVMNGGTWTSQSISIPPAPRYGMGFTSFNGDLWICGGFAGTVNPSPVGDCYSVDAAGAWTARPSLPSPRALLSMAADSVNGRVYAFGGRTSTGDTADLFVWSQGGSNWAPVVPTGGTTPAQRERAAAFFDTVAGRLVVVGGNLQGESTGLSDVDVFNPGTSTWTRVSGGPPPSNGYTVSGTIRTGIVSVGPVRPLGQIANETAYVYATSSSGWDGSAKVNIVGGTGFYSIRGIPPGDTISLNGYVVNSGATFPANLTSGVDMGEQGPFIADLTVDLDFPANAPPLVDPIDVTVPGWPIYTLFGNPFLQANGYPILRLQNGLGEQLDYRTVRVGYYPSMASRQDATAGGMAYTPGACEVSVHTLSGVSTPFPATSLEVPPRGLMPGLNECTPRGPASQLAATAIYKTGSFSSNPNSVAIGPINNDGVPDLAVSNGSDSTVGIWYGRGDGTYTFAYGLAVTGIPTALTLANIAGDPLKSLVVAVRGPSPAVQIFRNDGQGALTFQQSFPTGTDPGGVATADINNDTYPDLVTANTTAQSVTIVFSRSTGGYNSPTNLTTISCPNPHGVVAARLDGDTFPDIAVACQGSLPTYDNRIQVFKNLTMAPWVNPAPSFALSGPGGSGPFALAAGDVNGDNPNALDLVASNTAGPAATLFKSNTTGGFQPFLAVGAGVANGAMGVAVADVNADTKADIVVGNTGADQVLTYLNDGAPNFTFTPSQSLAMAKGPQGLAAGDVNGDNGRSDVVVPCANAGAFEVLLQQRPLSTVAEGVYQLTLPAGMSAVQLIRGPELQGMDWQYFTPISGGTSLSITLPATSMMAPPPIGSSPPGQIVGWTIGAYRTQSVQDWNTFRFGLLQGLDQTQAGASLYIRQ